GGDRWPVGGVARPLLETVLPVHAAAGVGMARARPNRPAPGLRRAVFIAAGIPPVRSPAARADRRRLRCDRRRPCVLSGGDVGSRRTGARARDIDDGAVYLVSGSA